MLTPWNELQVNRRLLFLLKSVAKNCGDGTQMACHACNRGFSDSQSFLDHFGYHVTKDGSLEPGLTFGRFLPSENPKNILSNPSPVGYSPNEGVPQNPPNLSFAGNNHLVPTQVQNCVLLRGPASHRGPPPYEKPSIFIRNPVKPKNSSSQRPELDLNLPRIPTPSDVRSSRSGKMSIFSSSVSRGASPSPCVQQSNFYPSVVVGSSASHSVGSTSGLVIHPPIRSFKRPTREDDVERVFAGRKKQYIEKPQQPSEEVIVVGSTSKKKPAKHARMGETFILNTEWYNG